MHLVMVGDDGSEAAAGALGWATRLAGERDAQLVRLRIAGAGQDAPSDDPIEGVSIVRENHPASGIMLAAHDRDADLIVLGRRGSGGFPSLPIGTTAHHVAAASERPVVVVPPTAASADAPLVERIVVGVDGLPGSMEAAAWAVASFGEARFTLVHALELAPAFVQSDDDSGAMYDRARTRVQALMQDEWARPLVEAGAAFDLVVDEGGPAEILLGVAARTGADLVVVGRRDHQPMRGTLGGVSQRVLAYAPCAAVIVPPPTEDGLMR